MKSVKTTILGISTMLAGIAPQVSAFLDNDPATVPIWSIAIAAFTAGIGLILSRDNDKSSEDVGAKK